MGSWKLVMKNQKTELNNKKGNPEGQKRGLKRDYDLILMFTSFLVKTKSTGYVMWMVFAGQAD